MTAAKQENPCAILSFPLTNFVKLARKGFSLCCGDKSVCVKELSLCQPAELHDAV